MKSNPSEQGRHLSTRHRILPDSWPKASKHICNTSHSVSITNIPHSQFKTDYYYTLETNSDNVIKTRKRKEATPGLLVKTRMMWTRLRPVLLPADFLLPRLARIQRARSTGDYILLCMILFYQYRSVTTICTWCLPLISRGYASFASCLGFTSRVDKWLSTTEIKYLVGSFCLSDSRLGT